MARSASRAQIALFLVLALVLLYAMVILPFGLDRYFPSLEPSRSFVIGALIAAVAVFGLYKWGLFDGSIPRPGDPDYDEVLDNFLSHKPRNNEKVAVLALLAAGMVVTIALLVWIGLPLLLAWSWSTIHELLSTSAGRLAGTAVLVAVAYLFYRLRQHFRTAYGAGEIFFGVIACWSGVANATNNAIPSVMAILGGIYIIVRGLDNYNVGRKG